MFEELSECSTCPLRLSKQKLGMVPGEGVGKSPYEAVWIGTAPAKTELKTKHVMSGPSGELGRSLGTKEGYENYFITNILSCFYPENATETHIKKASACCRPRLEAELKYLKPKLILALGNVPVKAMLGWSKSVMSLEGQVFETEFGTVMPIRQPASVLYRTDEYPDLRDAYRSGKRFLDGNFRLAADPETIIATEETLPGIMEFIGRHRYAVIDLETTTKGFYPYGMDPDKIRCIAMAVDEQTGYIIPAYLMHHKSVHEVIDTIQGIYHNSHFDCGFLIQEGFHPKVYYDTLLAHNLLDERAYAHGLKLLASKFLGAPPWEEELVAYLPNKKTSYDNIPDSVLYPYAAKDVVYTLQLAKIFLKKVASTGQGIYAQLLNPCVNMFNQVRHRGIRIDVQRLMNLDEDIAEVERETLESLHQEVGFPLSPTSPPEVMTYLYDTMGLPIIPQYGRTSNKKALKYYEDIEAVRLIIAAREALKLRSTYVKGTAKFVDASFRIHPFTKLWGAVTGRISTEDPSIMNVSKKGGIKSIYIPEPGHFLLDVDFKGIETRCYAAIMKDKHLIQMIKDGDSGATLDIHDTVAFEASERTGRVVTRGSAKTGVFGRMYKRGFKSMMYGFQMEEEDTRALLQIIDNMFPSLQEYNSITENQILSKGELVSWFGRRRRFNVVTEMNKEECFRQGVNFKVQTMASDINLFCMLLMSDMQEETGAVPLFPVHDNIVFDIVDPRMGPQIVDMMERRATELVKDLIPFKVKAQIGRNWGNLVDLDDYLSGKVVI